VQLSPDLLPVQLTLKLHVPSLAQRLLLNKTRLE
jgi:hypothetical protein